MVGKEVNRRRVIFLCTGNSARSQMAEGLARSLSRGAVEVHSAGLEPKGIHPLAVAVMDEIGIDIRKQWSKGMDPDALKQAGWIITLCDHADKRCPTVPDPVRKEHWPLEDPAQARGTDDEKLRVFRGIRDEIQERIRLFFSRAGLFPLA